ncbi:MAG: TolC family protein [Rubrivivax sp.]
MTTRQHATRAAAPLAAAAASSLALLLAAGCTTLGPDHQRPAVALPQSYGEASAATATSGTAPLAADWWTLFGDRTLDGLVAKALAGNGDIAQAVARVEQADALVREASGATKPTLSAGANASRARVSARARGNPTGVAIEGNDFQASLSTSFELDLWGKLARATEAARAQLLASQAARDTVRLTVAGAVAQAWFALRSLDEQIAAQRLTLRLREDTARVMGQRLAGGASTRLDVEQAETQRADAALALRELQRQRTLAQSQLALLTGEPGLAAAEAPLAAQAVPPLPPPGCLPSFSNAAPTCSGPSSCWWRPTRRSASPRRRCTPRSRSPAPWASRARSWPICSKRRRASGRSRSASRCPSSTAAATRRAWTLPARGSASGGRLPAGGGHGVQGSGRCAGEPARRARIGSRCARAQRSRGTR